MHEQIVLPLPVLEIMKRFRAARFDIYVVGGAVRDLLVGKETKDWDFTTNATPEQIQQLFPGCFYDNVYGTVGVSGEDVGDTEHPKEIYEITTYRSEGTYSDHRRPDVVRWGTTLEEDLQRRDFTINAMAIQQIDGSNACTIIDLYEGKKDLEDRMVRAVGDPSTRFQEDALRMMRAIRFGAQLGFMIHPDTLAAIQKNADLIQYISWERIRDEFFKILLSQYPEEGIILLYTTGLLQHIMPELLALREVQQSRHHIYDVWTHTLKSVAACPSHDPIVRLAVLLHDIAKPQTQKKERTKEGVINTFFNHEVLGARIARHIAARLKLSKSDIQRVFILVRWHMFVYDRHMTDAYIRRFIRRVGKEHINDMMDLREADRLGSGSKKTSWRLEEMKKRIEGQLHQPFSINDLAVDGTDVMRELKIQPGKIVGDTLQSLFKEVLDDPTKNTREYLLKKIQKMGKKK